MRRVLQWGAVGFLVFYIVTQPNEAANGLLSILGGLRFAATGFGNFVSSLVT